MLPIFLKKAQLSNDIDYVERTFPHYFLGKFFLECKKKSREKNLAKSLKKLKESLLKRC